MKIMRKNTLYDAKISEKVKVKKLYINLIHEVHINGSHNVVSTDTCDDSENCLYMLQILKLEVKLRLRVR